MPRQTSNHALAAKMIRAELKRNNIKGRVRAKSYSGGSSVRVELTNELPATVKAVRAFAERFQYGHFDGMTDCYEYSNRNGDLPQVKFVFVENWIDDSIRADAWRYAKAYFAGCSDSDTPITYDDDVKLGWIMSGQHGTWLRDRKPRLRAA